MAINYVIQKLTILVEFLFDIDPCFLNRFATNGVNKSGLLQ